MESKVVARSRFVPISYQTGDACLSWSVGRAGRQLSNQRDKRSGVVHTDSCAGTRVYLPPLSPCIGVSYISYPPSWLLRPLSSALTSNDGS